MRRSQLHSSQSGRFGRGTGRDHWISTRRIIMAERGQQHICTCTDRVRVCVCVYAWMDNFIHCRASDTLMFEILDLSIIEARSTISAQPVSSTAISRSRS